MSQEPELTVEDHSDAEATRARDSDAERDSGPEAEPEAVMRLRRLRAENIAKRDKELERLFPNCPFKISCVPCLCHLDIMFIRSKTVIIYDDRAEEDWYFDEDEVKAAMRLLYRRKHQYLHYTIVRSGRGGYITMRDMLEAMIQDPHYHQDLVQNNPHRILERFNRKQDFQGVFKHPCYTCSWGS